MTLPSTSMSPAERMRLRAAALTAVRRYPGPIGELVAQEIAAWEDFGHRLAPHGLIGRVVAELLGEA